MPESHTEDPDWDSRCLQCGRCCFEKIEDERGTIFYTLTACRFLDIVSRKCKIYDRRFVINPSCVKLTKELVPTLRWLPRNCGYHRKAVEAAPTTRNKIKRQRSE